MKCEVCQLEPEWNDFPAPDGWTVCSRGYAWETWRCRAHRPEQRSYGKAAPVGEKRGRLPGTGHDNDWQRALLGHTLPVVPQLGGRGIVWPEKWTRPWGKPGCRAPTVDSIDDPGRRREFMKLNPQFQET